MKNILLDFNEMGGAKDAATKAIKKAFAKAGAVVAQADVSAGAKRTSGITYREMLLIFADSQTVSLMVKQSGDIFQVRLNGKVIPIKSQDDHQAAANELAAKMNAGRTAFQKKLASVKAALPATIRTAAPKLETALTERANQLDELIADVQNQIDELKAPVKEAA